MPKVPAFNPFVLIEPRHQPDAKVSWWIARATESRGDFYVRAAAEVPRMNKAPEAKRLQPRCLDDLCL